MIAALTAIIASAEPANPMPVNVTQPDGTTLQLRLVGDEFYHFKHLSVAGNGKEVIAEFIIPVNISFLLDCAEPAETVILLKMSGIISEHERISYLRNKAGAVYTLFAPEKCLSDTRNRLRSACSHNYKLILHTIFFSGKTGNKAAHAVSHKKEGSVYRIISFYGICKNSDVINKIFPAVLIGYKAKLGIISCSFAVT